MLLEIDVQGALKVKGLERVDAVLVFLMPPSLEELRRRLAGPGDRVAGRARPAGSPRPRWRMARAPEFDHVVVNDDLERVVGEVAGILSGSPPS